MTALVLVGVAALAPRPLSAQSLAAVAQQEEGRRAAVKQPSKAYTNADVQGAEPGNPPASAGDTAPEGYLSKSTGRYMTADEMLASSRTVLANEEQKKDEPFWRNRAKSIRAEAEKARATVETLAAASNAEAPAQAAALDRARAVLAEAEKQLLKFETQAGAARIPKAWIQ